MRIELVQWIHPLHETKDYKTRYIFTIVFYEHAQMNNRVNRALLMETYQSENCTIFLGKSYNMIFPLCTTSHEKGIVRVGESGGLF